MLEELKVPPSTLVITQYCLTIFKLSLVLQPEKHLCSETGFRQPVLTVLTVLHSTHSTTQ